ncbi:MAG: DUF2709 domain-containing protein [Parachlamydiales bacterium]|nr:DUF2709 domain-containing protein [Parachlamydiales bacterium]
MTALVITDDLKIELERFLKKFRTPELINTYLFFVEKKFNLHPVLFTRDKTIFQSRQDSIKALENEGKLWRETEIKIGFNQPSVNEQTKKIYICPFTGKVFGDNTHPHPQDAIYDWVSQCPENTERIDGVKVKRFFVSEDPEVIKNYITPRKKGITKVVYSSALSGKLFNTKDAVIKDFTDNYLKDLSLVEVQGQNRFQIEEGFLSFIKKQLEQPKIAAFVEALADHDIFMPYVSQWIDEG